MTVRDGVFAAILVVTVACVLDPTPGEVASTGSAVWAAAWVVAVVAVWARPSLVTRPVSPLGDEHGDVADVGAVGGDEAAGVAGVQLR